MGNISSIPEEKTLGHILDHKSRGAVLRWWRNRMGRWIYLPQIHQKIIWKLSNFHKTTSEHWWRTPGTQRGNTFSSKGGRTKYKRQKCKRVRDGDLSWEGVVKEKFWHSRKPSHRWVCGEFWNLRRQHNWEKRKTKFPQNRQPNRNCQKRELSMKGANLTT